MSLLLLLACTPDDAALTTQLPDAQLLLDMPDYESLRVVGDPSILLSLSSERADQIDDTTQQLLGLISTFSAEASDHQRDGVSSWSRPGADSAHTLELRMWELEGGGVGWVAARARGEQLLQLAAGTDVQTEEGTRQGSIALALEAELADAELDLPSLNDLPPVAREDPSQPLESNASSSTAIDFIESPADGVVEIIVQRLEEEGTRHGVHAIRTPEGGQVQLATFGQLAGQDAVLALRTRWQGDGAGRSDGLACSPPCEDLAADTLGTVSDCFGPDGRVDHQTRSWAADEGSAEDCVFEGLQPDPAIQFLITDGIES